ncbi:MAG: glycine betaine ABC transporter substrate-binding protein [Coprobacillaceae bacterium]
MIQEIITLLSTRKDFFLSLLWEHIYISLIAIIIATIIGLFLGICISEYKKSSKFILNIINFIYTIPSISLLGFLIPLSGIGNTTAIIALTVYALLPMVRNTYTGITTIDNNIIEAAKGMGSTNFQILYKIKLPLAIPVIMSGLRNMVTMTIALAGIASFIGAGGLGVAIYRGITTNNSTMTIVGSLMIALLALIIDWIFGILERTLRHRSKSTHKTKVLMGLVAALSIGLISVPLITNNKKEEVINLATKPMSEQYILGEMMKELIEYETDITVNITQGVGGGTSNIQPAMEKGEFDMYPEYTGTGWNAVLKKNGLYTENQFMELEDLYQQQYDFSWPMLYGFNNTYGLVVRKEIADQYNIETYSDLAAIASQLTFGAEYDFFEREDGYDALCNAYQLYFNNTIDLDIGLKYQAINEGKIDVMNIFTTDGQLSESDVVVLTDDKEFYPSYACGLVVRNEILTKYPELDEIFKSLSDSIDDTTMAKMNYEVEENGKEPKDVAHDFLVTNGFIK